MSEELTAVIGRLSDGYTAAEYVTEFDRDLALVLDAARQLTDWEYGVRFENDVPIGMPPLWFRTMEEVETCIGLYAGKNGYQVEGIYRRRKAGPPEKIDED